MTEGHVGLSDPLAKTVCSLVQARAAEIYLFGLMEPVCEPRDTYVLQGDPNKHKTGNPASHHWPLASHHLPLFTTVISIRTSARVPWWMRRKHCGIKV